MPQPGPNSIAARVSQEKSVESGGAWRLMSFMLFVFLVFLASYLGLTFGYGKYLDAQISGVNRNLDALASRVGAGDQDAFLKFQFQLLNLRTLLASHVAVSRIFPVLEANTNVRVQLTGLDINIPELRVDIRGLAQSYGVLSEQLLAYDRLPQVLRYQLMNAQVAEGGRVSFTATVFFKESVVNP